MAETLPLLNPAPLADAAAFTVRFGAGGWLLSRHRIESTSLRRLPVGAARLTDVEFHNVEFFDIDWKGAVFERVLFANCTFHRGSFTDAVLKDCRLQETELRAVGFRGFRTERGKWTAVTLKSGRLEGCAWQGTELDRVVFTEVGEFVAPVWTDSTLRDCRLAMGRCERASFVNCQVEGLQLLKQDASGWRWTGGRAARVVTESSAVQDWAMQQTALEGVVFNAESAALPTARLVIARSPSIAGLAFSGPATTVAISECPAVTRLKFLSAVVTDLDCRALTVEGWVLRNSKLVAPAKLKDCRLTHSDWSDSSVEGLELESVTLAGVLNLERARFKALSAKRVTHAPQLEPYLTGATFTDGDSLAPR